MTPPIATMEEPCKLISIPHSERRYEADVLIIGGGVAGCMAAIGAREKGASVILVEKSVIERSGQAGSGNDNLMVHLNEASWDTDEAVNKWFAEDALCDVKVVDKVVTKRLREIINRLEDMGISFRKEKTGKYFRTQAFGQPGPWWVVVQDATELKPIISRTVRKHGVQMVNWTMVTDLLTDNKSVVGAVGFNIRTGELCVFSAKCTILATGDATRLANNSTGNPFNAYMYPYSTGTAQVLGFKAGAEVADLELGKGTISPKGFMAPGMNSLAGMNCHMLNKNGERYMFRYHLLGEKAPRSAQVIATLKESADGRGPCYVDVRHLTSEDREFLIKELLNVDKATFVTFLKQKGINLSTDLMEIEPTEISAVKGLLIDEKCATTVERLYGAGSCTSIHSWAGASAAMACGLSAGLSAGETVSSLKLIQPNTKDYEDIIQHIFAPLKRKSGITRIEFESRLRKIMDELVSFYRDEKGLKQALSSLQELEALVPDLIAENTRELMRVNESRHLIVLAKLITVGALARKESRNFHYRTDYERKSDVVEHVVLTKGSEGEVLVSNKPVH